MADVLELDNEETEAEREARREVEVYLDEDDQHFVDKLVDKLMAVTNDISGRPLREYQIPFGRRIFESLIIDDGAEITVLMCRQSGKTETVAAVLATAMIMLPRLAKIYPNWLDKFKDGVWVGAFAPVARQVNILFNRIVGKLSSERTKEFMAHPEINDRVTGMGATVRLVKCGSLVRKTSCHPRTIIEGDTFHVILIDEAQGGDDKTVNKSVLPMGADTNATVILTGTPTYQKNFFYTSIQINKRLALKRGRTRQNHFQVPWQVVAKHVPRYRKYVMKQKIKLGEDSDEFKLSYEITWLLEKGMFTTGEKFAELEDRSMQSVVHAWRSSPIVVGIDCGRIKDRTIATAVFVDWNRPDAAGFYYHQVLDWLDLEGMDWEQQYFRLKEWLDNYNIYKVNVDSGGLGDVVLDRLRTLMPYLEFEAAKDDVAEQSRRFKYLLQLMNRHQIAWPGGAKVKTRKTFRRFRQEMEDLKVEFKGPNMRCQAPDEENAHDDYPQSLAMACVLSQETKDDQDDRVVVYDNMLYRRNR